MMDLPASRSRRPQRGQLLVIFAGALVLIMAIAALVVDIGFIFMLRRQEQNAADPAALAAARYIPAKDTGQMWAAACFYAVQNGFAPKRSDNNADCPGAGAHDGSFVTVNYPPSAAAVEFAGHPGYVEVTVRRQHKSFFAGVLGMPTVTVATPAVAAWDTGTAGASSLVSLKATGCSTATIHGGGGSGGVYIFPATGVPPEAGGFVQVNSTCGAADGADDQCTSGPSSAMTIAGGTYLRSNTVYIQGGCTNSGSSSQVFSAFDERAAYVGDPLALLRPPSPVDLVHRQCPTGPTTSPTSPKKCDLNGNVTLQPGTYYGGWKINSSTKVTLEPGIYIIAGGGIDQTSGVTESEALGRVLIYSTDSPACGSGGGAVACQGKLDFTGSTTLNLRGLDKNAACPPYGSTGCPYGGLLFWQDANGSGAGTDKANIELSGGGSLYLEGTVYSARGEAKITGNGLSTGCTPDADGKTNCAAVQIIAETWDVGGGGVLAMPYDPSAFFNPKLKGLVR